MSALILLCLRLSMKLYILRLKKIPILRLAPRICLVQALCICLPRPVRTKPVCIYCSIYHLIHVYVPDEPESQPENEGVNLNGSLLLVPWSCLLLLLSVCKHEGCGAQVLPSNMDISRRGTKWFPQY